MSVAVLRRIDLPDHAALIEALDQAALQGLILVTDGKDLKYTLPGHIPAGWTRFAMRVKPQPLDPKTPRA